MQKNGSYCEFYFLLSKLFLYLGSILSATMAQIFLISESPASERSRADINIDGISYDCAVEVCHL